MASNILTWSGQQVVDLAIGQFARPVTLPTGWRTVRIGVRCFLSIAGALAGTPKFYIGLQKGTALLPGDASSEYFIGIASNSATWSNSAGFIYNIGMYAAERNGAAYNFSASAVKSDARMFAPAYAYPAAWFVDITAGAPNYGVNLWTPQTGASDITYSGFIKNMVAITPSQTNYTWGTERTIATPNEATAGRNAVAVWWDRAAPDMYITDLAVVVLR